jgi:hypothetical protein
VQYGVAVGKYDPLRAFMNEQASSEVEMSFGDLEALVGQLPKAARAGDEWWRKDSAVQTDAWRVAGWDVSSVDRLKEIVSFARIQDGAADFRRSTPGNPASEASRLSGPPIAGTAGADRVSAAEVDGGSSKKTRLWPTVLAAAVSIAGGATANAVGLAALPRWAVLLISVDLAIFVTLFTSAIANEKYRVIALWTSNIVLAVLVAGIAMYNLIPQGSVTVNVVPNSDVTLSSQAGSQPDMNNPDGIVLPAGADETVTCYSVVSGKTWLYFHFSVEQYGWAPFDDFHYDPGFASQLPSTCA